MSMPGPSGVAASVPAKFPLNMVDGVPDDSLCRVVIAKERTKVLTILPGTSCISPYLPPAFFAVKQIYFGPETERKPVAFGPGPVINHVADADRCSKALAKTEEFVAKMNRACFNHPRAIARTTRDQVARTLAHVPGVRMPRTIRTTITHSDELAGLVEGENLTFPVIVRIAGDHGGVSTVKIDDPAGFHAVAPLNCYNRPIYITEFCDFASADGLYRKFRVVVVGEQVFLRHLVIGNNWLLHARRRTKDTQAEELHMLQNFDTSWGGRLEPVFLQIADLLDLDFFGIDCNISEGGEILIFEANACMNIMENTEPSPNIWDEPVGRIRQAVIRLIGQPRRWRHPPPQQATLAPA